MSLDSSRSPNPSSKRTFSNSNSASSNLSSFNNNNNNNNKKKRKKTIMATLSTKQKTLGVVWGSNSHTGSYMEDKNRKLHNQFHTEAAAAAASTSSSFPSIFSGVSIFVDGFTVPSTQELRSYMLKYGGRFENYFSRHHVTHIICTNLPHTKLKNLRAFSAGLPVVKPTWILDSVAANRLLSWVPYQLDQLVNNQPKLSSFFTLKSHKMSEDAFTNALCQAVPDVEDSSMRDGQSKDTDSSGAGEVVELSRQLRFSSESDDILTENNNAITMEEPTSVRVRCGEEGIAEGSNADIGDERNVQGELDLNHQEYCMSVSASRSESPPDQNVKELSSSETSRPSKHFRSTLADPNFVENYFKSSRLHFIGTWRNRYRKHFPVSSTGFNNENSNIHASQNPLIIHVDMDCFFVSVVIRNHPELLDKPVAVCHSNNSKGTSEISSANYPARGYGIRAGMFVRDAKALCPHLVISPYNFEAYEEVADQFYSILHRHCSKVQAVSCDEAFLDVTDSKVEDPKLFASSIRKEIYETTGCTASAGIAGNMLMARIATRTAKPNGQYHITPDKVEYELTQLSINALPGIGHVLQQKLKKQKVHTCGQLQMISKASLQKDYGVKTGEMLWNYSRGIDNRMVGAIQESKSIGADVNWGVRFKDMKDCDHFLINLSKEVSLRLQGCGVQGRTFTLKIKKRRKDAEEPAKFMGCGDCENLSHSITIPLATDNVEVIQRIVKQLFGFFYIDVKDIRGIGLQVTRLESVNTSKQRAEKCTLKSWLTSESASMGKQKYPMGNKQNIDGMSGHGCRDLQGSSVLIDSNILNNQASADTMLTAPSLCQLDVEVVKNLPPEVFSELNEMYGGKLVDFVAKGEGTNESARSVGNLIIEQEAINKDAELSYSDRIPQNKLLVENKVVQKEEEGVEVGTGSRDGSYVKVTHISSFEKDDLLPSSLSQVDASVLRQLPEDLKAAIVEQLPTHRRQESCSNAVVAPLSEIHQAPVGIKSSENHSGSSDHVSSDSLWAGNPPHWIDKFEVSNCFILKRLAEIYYRSGLTSTLSSVLHKIISEFHELDLAHQISDETVNIMCELLKQYTKEKIETDIEEIYICFRLLKRFAAKSQFFLQVYNTLFPHLQAAVDDAYGGTLFIPS
ncbi:PREDICTED: DNA repair protein REV1 isoform X2 [Lupinus angustifolius]|uniref:DNA repair protein REV1 isoform X2 n=1 Tax=Lupinus angustifolius TaxID=3871 RepID=UPI00092E9CB5|nr:PREDICTED: DNA repair protein REV1 isoform X2 [Lupinus angustifolius]